MNGYIFLMDAGGMRGGYEDATLEKLAKKAKQWKVNEVVIEGNFGDGMYLKLFEPVVARVHPCLVTEVKSKGQKEMRIADTLESVMGSHRLVVNESVINNDYQSAANADGVRDINYSLFYQLTRLSRERGALAHDDRLDALAIGVAFFVESMAKDSQKGAQELTEEYIMEHMEQAIKGFSGAREVTSLSSFGSGDGLLVVYEDDSDSGNFMGW